MPYEHDSETRRIRNERICVLRREGKTYKEIAAEVGGITFGKVALVCQTMGIARDMRVVYNQKQKDDAIAMRREGKSKPEIMAVTGMATAAQKELYRENAIVLSRENMGKLLGGTRRWRDFVVSAEAKGFRVLDQRDPDSFINGFKNNPRMTCPRCDRVFVPSDLYAIMDGHRRSCGCIRSAPQEDILRLVEGWGMVVQRDAPLTGHGGDRRQIDVYVPSKRIGIEYCGLRWHGQINAEDCHGTRGAAQARIQHRAKTADAAKRGVRIITVFADEWQHRRSQVEGYLRSALGCPSVRIGARRLEVVEVDISEVRKFLDDNHVFGSANGTSYALRHGGVIVGAAVFRRRSGGEWDMSRYCVGIGYAVPGGLARVLAFFARSQPDAKSVVTFSDKRWSAGGIYERNGFLQEASLPPSYWYFKANAGDRAVRIHKTNFRKDRIAAKFGPLLDGETEWDAMKRHGYDRIWDCGYVRWRLDLVTIRQCQNLSQMSARILKKTPEPSCND